MKPTRILTILMLSSLAAVYWSCENDDNFLEYKNPIPLKTELLEGVWKTQKVVQVDKEALDNGFPEDVQQRDITTLFPFEEYQIEFILDASGRPGTFTVTPGNSPNFLSIVNGIWSLDDLVFARTISLTNPAELYASSFRIEILKEDTIKLHIVRIDFVDGKTEYSYYQFEFAKQ